MKKNDISLRPIHYACVSGGKDSLYMLNIIINNLGKYPLEMVVHYQLEIDWDFAEKVIDIMEERCTRAGIRFIRIKPRKTWKELYERYGFPSRKVRWCNSKYKMDCVRQIKEWIKEQECRPVAYIGLCADEINRFKYEIGNWETQEICYPLAEEGIEEKTILEWAKKTDVFNGWYKYFKRQGCKLCPMIARKELAYMCKYENDTFKKLFEYIKIWEEKNNGYYFGKPWDEAKKNIETKWVSILEQEENQVTIFDFDIEG